MGRPGNAPGNGGGGATAVSADDSGGVGDGRGSTNHTRRAFPK